MKNIGFIGMAILLSVGVMAGCAEKKQPAEKAAEAPVQAEEAVPREPAEMKEQAPAAVEAPEGAAAETAMKKAVEVKEEAAAAVKKVAVKVEEKVGAVVAAVEKSVEKPVAEPAVPVAEVKDVKAGAAIYVSKCAPCHGAMGKGTPMAPAFIGNEWAKSAADAEIAAVIKNGRAGADKRYPKFPIGMPPQKGMADADVSALVDYIKSVN